MLFKFKNFSSYVVIIIIIIIIIIIGTTAHFEPRPSSEASASRPYSLQHSSRFSLPPSWHHPSRRSRYVVITKFKSQLKGASYISLERNSRGVPQLHCA